MRDLSALSFIEVAHIHPLRRLRANRVALRESVISLVRVKNILRANSFKRDERICLIFRENPRARGYAADRLFSLFARFLMALIPLCAQIHSFCISRKYAANGVRFGNSVVLPRAVNYFILGEIFSY